MPLNSKQHLADQVAQHDRTCVCEKHKNATKVFFFNKRFEVVLCWIFYFWCETLCVCCCRVCACTYILYTYCLHTDRQTYRDDMYEHIHALICKKLSLPPLFPGRSLSLSLSHTHTPPSGARGRCMPGWATQ